MKKKNYVKREEIMDIFGSGYPFVGGLAMFLYGMSAWAMA